MGGAQPQQRPAASPFLITPEVATRLRRSVRTAHELARQGSIPHRRLPGSRRCLFREDELEAWERGAPLETVALERGSRLVRPITRSQGTTRPDEGTQLLPAEAHGIRNPRGSDRVPSKRMVMPAVGTAHCQDSAEIPVPQAPPRRMDKPVVLNEAKARPLRTARVGWPLAGVSRSPLEGRRRPACSAGRLPHTRGSARDARRGGRTRRQRRHRLLHRLRSLRA